MDLSCTRRGQKRACVEMKFLLIEDNVELAHAVLTRMKLD
mgnify:CR=1 FL=1